MRDYIGSLDSEVRREGCLNEIAGRLGVDYSSVHKDITRAQKTNEYNRTEKTTQIQRNSISSELFLMIAVVVNRENFSYVRSRIEMDDFVITSYSIHYTKLYEF